MVSFVLDCLKFIVFAIGNVVFSGSLEASVAQETLDKQFGRFVFFFLNHNSINHLRVYSVRKSIKENGVAEIFSINRQFLITETVSVTICYGYVREILPIFEKKYIHLPQCK